MLACAGRTPAGRCGENGCTATLDHRRPARDGRTSDSSSTAHAIVGP
jgi:hypothetical protein